MSEWLEAYKTWPPSNQMLFSVITLILGLISLFLAGMWLLQLLNHFSVWLRGWPPVSEHIASSTHGWIDHFQRWCGTLPGLRKPGNPINWKAEQKQQAEERDYQAKLQEELAQPQYAANEVYLQHPGSPPSQPPPKLDEPVKKS